MYEVFTSDNINISIDIDYCRTFSLEYNKKLI